MDFRNLELRSFPQAALEIGIGTQAAGMRRQGGELDSDVPSVTQERLWVSPIKPSASVSVSVQNTSVQLYRCNN